MTNRATLTWGDQRTVWGFFKHLLRVEYGTFDLVAPACPSLAGGHALTPPPQAKGGRETASFMLAVQTHVASLSEETLHLAVPLAVAGAWSGRAIVTCRVLLAALALYMGFFNWRANLDLTNALLAGVHERFWMQPNYVIALFAGLGYDAVVRVGLPDGTDAAAWLTPPPPGRYAAARHGRSGAGR